MEEFIVAAIQVMGRLWQAIDNSPWTEEIIRFATAQGPVQMVLLFLFSSMLMIWRLNAVEQKGFEGTMVGTLVMPYCSGFANLAFAFVLGRSHGDGSLVLENCIVNNLTNLTLVLGLAAMIWGMRLHDRSGDTNQRLSFFSLLLSLITLIFFTGAIWTLARDGVLDFSDGLMLCGLFVFWQVIHIFEAMKLNIQKDGKFRLSVFFDFALAGLGAWACLHSIEGLVNWITAHGSGWLSVKYLGLLSGGLMVIPNALLAFYYAARGRADIAYSSQMGDCHICIPLCVGLYALFTPITLPPTFETGSLLILASGAILLVFTALTGRIPRLIGGCLAIGYGIFMVKGLGQI